MKKTRISTATFFLAILLSLLFSGCATTPSAWQIPENGLLNEYVNPELARFYPEPPSVPPEAAWQTSAAAHTGDTYAQLRLGMLYLTGTGYAKDTAAAWAWFEKAAENGNDDALVMQGTMLFNGLGVKRDRVAALALFEKAAQNGNKRALFELGTIHYRGQFMNREKAEVYFKKAVEKGYTPAMLALGSYYLSTEKSDDPQYKEKGKQLVLAAAEKGDLVAQYVMGVFTYEGLHFEKDKKAARIWYTRAAEQGSPQARKELADMDTATE